MPSGVNASTEAAKPLKDDGLLNVLPREDHLTVVSDTSVCDTSRALPSVCCRRLTPR
jgi:hypothetical protein